MIGVPKEPEIQEADRPYLRACRSSSILAWSAALGQSASRQKENEGRFPHRRGLSEHGSDCTAGCRRHELLEPADDDPAAIHPRMLFPGLNEDGLSGYKVHAFRPAREPPHSERGGMTPCTVFAGIGQALEYGAIPRPSERIPLPLPPVSLLSYSNSGRLFPKPECY